VPPAIQIVISIVIQIAIPLAIQMAILLAVQIAATSYVDKKNLEIMLRSYALNKFLQ
jgi:hypothetical protein